jgi:hypothetical protein
MSLIDATSGSTSASWVTVMFAIFLVVSGQIIRVIGIKKGKMTGIIIITILSFWGSKFIDQPVPVDAVALQDVVDVIKGFVVASGLIGFVIGKAEFNLYILENI